MGNSKGKMNDEIMALKAEIVTMKRRQAYEVSVAVKKAEHRLALECEEMVREERSRVDQIEEQKSVAMLQNELLTEMVAAEQINVRLQERRNQALKWELLRQGGAQETLVNIAKEVPELGGALEADTAEVLQDVAKHDMSEAIEYVVCGLKEVEDDLMQAFLTRDKGRTGSLGSSDFKDALRECLPDMPLAGRRLLVLRFIQEIDQSIYYVEFLEFCRRKARSRERLKMGLTGALAATRSVGYRGGASSVGDARTFAATIPSGKRQAFLATTQAFSRSGDLPTSFRGSQDRRNRSFSSQGTVTDSESTVLAERKIAGIIARRGDDMELLFKKADPAGSGVIPVKAFSECLRSWDVISNTEESLREERLLLTRYDRKALYRKWAVHGQVRYVDFLRAGGYFDTPLSRSTMDRLTPTPRRETSPAMHQNADTKSVEGIRIPRLQGQARQPPEEEDEEFLAARIEALMVHLSELVEEKGEEAFFSEFEGRDAEDVRSLDKGGFVDAIVDFAPEITTEQALEVFRARPQEIGGNVDYDKLLKELLKISQLKNFQVGDKVQLREGWFRWVHAEVVSRGKDGTYTVRFISRVPWRGFVTEHGVSESRLRVALRKDTTRWERKKKSVGEFTTKVASWLSGLPGPSLIVKQTRAGSISTRLKQFIGCNKGRARGNTKAHRTWISRFTKRKRHRLKDSNGVEQSASGARADDEVSNYGHNESPKESTELSEEEHVHRTPRRCRSDAATTATSKMRNKAYSDIDSSRSNSDTEWANDGNVSENVASYSPSTDRLGRSRNDRKAGSTRGKRRGGRKGTGSAKSSSRSISEFPAIREVLSPPRGKRHPSQSRQREKSLPSTPLERSLGDQRHSPSAVLGRSRTSRNGGLTVDGRVQSRNGGLESPESLRDGNMEEKFELYKKRTKEALSPERRFDGSGTSCRAGNRAHSNH